MRLTLALHHEQNMPAVKVKYTLRHTHENVLNHVLFTCATCDKFVVANGRPAGCLGGLGQSIWIIQMGGGSLPSVQTQRFLNPEERSDMCV